MFNSGYDIYSRGSTATNRICEHEFVDPLTLTFECDVCKHGGGDVYACKTCHLRFHDECRFFKETDKKGHKEHKYKLTSYNKIFTCDRCKEDGFGKRFRCDQCGNELHTMCWIPKKISYATGVTKEKFEFQEKKELTDENRLIICGACTNNINGCYYKCATYVHKSSEEKGLSLHPSCLNLRIGFIKGNSGKEGATNLDEKRYFLSFQDEEDMRNTIKCTLCKHNTLRNEENGNGWAYVCVGKKDEHKYHLWCVKELVHEAWATADGINFEDFEKALDYMPLGGLANTRKKTISETRSFLKGLGKVLLSLINILAHVLMGNPIATFADLYGVYQGIQFLVN